VPSAPTTEQGTTNPSASLALPGWGSLGGAMIDDIEKVPALKWPNSVRLTYPAMRNDSQVEALFYATTLPIRRYRWMLDPNGARPEIVAALAADLGLPLKGSDPGPIGRNRGRFSFSDHLRLALEALLFGHYFFEQVAPIGDDMLAHLRKLAPRAPHSIENIDTAPDGGLRSIRQTFGTNGTLQPTPLSVDRIVAYVWDQSPGQWTGRSMLRSIYREWNLKDRLLRVDTVKHERNGLGIPVARATNDEVSPKQLAAAQAVASAWRVGEHASATLPYGTDIDLKGVQGNLPDTLASIQRHDEAMSKRWLGMLIDLANTNNGSRALGDTHSDLIELGRDAIASWICDVFTDHVIEDYVDWNWAGEEFVPRLTYERDPGPQPVQAPPSPQPPVPSAPIGAPAATTKRVHRVRSAFATARVPLSEPSPLRRELFAHETASGADFTAIDAQWRGELEQLLTNWEAVTASEIDDLVAQIKGAGSLEDLAAVQAAASGATILTDSMQRVAAEGAATARAEAAAQGIDIEIPDLAATNASLSSRAVATDVLLARSISEAGGREALRQAGMSTSNDDIAEAVGSHLEGLSTAYLSKTLGGSVSTGLNYGRATVMAAAERAAGGAKYYASEILDANTCGPCADIDGEEFADFDDMNANYATGGYVLCEGGDNCRGTAVAVYDEA
jgi:hypothetical protein